MASGGGAWGWVVLAVFAVTVLTGLVNVDLHALVAGILDAEGWRIFYTFAGIAIASVVMFLASLLQIHRAASAAPQEAKAQARRAPAN